MIDCLTLLLVLFAIPFSFRVGGRAGVQGAALPGSPVVETSLSESCSGLSGLFMKRYRSACESNAMICQESLA